MTGAPPGRPPRRILAAVSSLLWTAVSPVAALQGEVRNVAMAAVAAGDGAPTRVELVYEIALEGDAEEVPLRWISFGGAAPAALRAEAGGVELPIRLGQGRHLLAGAASLPPGPAAAGDDIRLVVTYDLPGPRPGAGEAFDLVLPVLLADLPVRLAAGDMFTAEVRVPADWAIVETFPTVPARVTAEAGWKSWKIGLQVIPSVVRVRGVVGSPPLLAFARRVDLAVVAVILAAGVLAWRRLAAR